MVLSIIYDNHAYLFNYHSTKIALPLRGGSPYNPL